MRSLVIIIVYLTIAYAFTDVRSESAWFSIAFPIALMLGFVALAGWFVTWLYRRRGEQRTSGLDDPSLWRTTDEREGGGDD